MKEKYNTRKYNHYLFDLIIELKLNPKSFAESLGFKRTDRIYNVLKGLNGISNDLARIITDKYPSVNYEWLLTGIGNMFINYNQIQPTSKVDTVDNIQIPDLEDDDLEAVDNSFGNKFVKLPNGEYLMYMPLFEWNVAASLLDNEGDTRHPDYEEVEQYATIVKKPLRGKYSAFRIKGVSMEGTEPGKFIADGSIAWGRELQMVHWKSLLNIKKYPLWIVGSTEFGRPTLKEIVSHDVSNATIVVDSWNPSAEYAHNVPISLNTVKMLYYVMKIETPIADGNY